tara:strand:- start:37 stop:228 length:192 start_codon:yes stop_codon:yes gene_type:complete
MQHLLEELVVEVVDHIQLYLLVAVQQLVVEEQGQHPTVELELLEQLIVVVVLVVVVVAQEMVD